MKMIKSFKRCLHIHPSVSHALQHNTPIVALESTIISHGMPYPQNVETALQVQDIITEQGCIPATIAILNGEIKVGLTPQEIETLGKSNHVYKTSRRDLPLVMTKKWHGATTVSSTMLIAHQAGIKVFVTGGIGGVHRGVEESFDISADLTELGKTPVAVICAGAKSILDIEKTLEYLETQGVTCISYGETDDFPAFYTRKSGFKSMYGLDSIQECASLLKHHTDLNLSNGIVIACPISEKDALFNSNENEIESMIQQSVQEMRNKNIKGKQVTPYLLNQLKQLTFGQSLNANIALVKNNALIGSRIAKAYSLLMNSKRSYSVHAHRPLIIGASVMDMTSTYTHENPVPFSSNPGTIKYSLGGVARNVAEACHRTGGSPIFSSIVGSDLAGESILSELNTIGLETQWIQQSRSCNHQTAAYNAILDKQGEMQTAIADMEITKTLLNTDILKETNGIVSMDANISDILLKEILLDSIKRNRICIYEPTSVPKSIKIMKHLHDLYQSMDGMNSRIVITPNRDELIAMSRKSLTSHKTVNPPLLLKSLLAEFSQAEQNDIPNALYTCSLEFELIILKLGPKGVLVAHQVSNSYNLTQKSNANYQVYYPINTNTNVVCTLLKPKKVYNQVVSVTGAGDSLVGSFISGLSKSPNSLSNPDRILDLVNASMKASLLSLQSEKAVHPELSSRIFTNISWF